jgi:hypothetical protein
MQASPWAVECIQDHPDKTLDAWSVYEVSFQGRDGVRTRHVAGFAREGCKVRVSTAIVAFDPNTRCCRTQSGRVYFLAGQPGFSADVLAVWSTFKRVNRVAIDTDVTWEVDAALSAAGLTPERMPAADCSGITTADDTTEPKVPTVVSVALGLVQRRRT